MNISIRCNQRWSAYILPTLLMLAGLCMSSTALAADVKGSKDHPLIGRFAGSEIIGYSHKNFDEYLFPESEVFADKDKKSDYKITSTTVEGEVTRILYVAPKDASVIEVIRNYQKQLQRKGFQRVLSCKSKEYHCGYWMTGNMESFQPPLVEYAYKFEENRYISMKKPDPNGDIYVSILVYNYTFSMMSYYNHPMVQLDVIKAEPLDDTQIVVLKADKMSDTIKTSGHVALHGIYFDTNSAQLKSTSDPSLEEIGKLLKSDATLKLYVVGHTDNTGVLAHNMTLSKQRAGAVVNALVSRYGASPALLMAHGVGPLAPVAANTSEEGRAKNRRVDLVRQ